MYGRPAVRFVDDPELAYVMQRYREVHDFWHVLTGVPTTVLGEIALKWYAATHARTHTQHSISCAFRFEMYQTGLPMTALSSVVGPLRLPVSEMRVLYSEYIPWAKRSATNATFLMNFYYERRLQDDLAAIRDELRLEPWHQHKHY
jgi:ubiquinone biosynthesis protein COQ4